MLQRVENAFATLSGVAVVAMMVLLTSDVVARYVFNSPLTGVGEIVELYLMVGIVYLMLAQTQRVHRHVRVAFLIDRLPPRIRTVLEFVDLLIMAVMLGAIAYASYVQLQQRWGGELGGSVHLPTGPSWLLIPVGVGLMFARVVVQLVRIVTGRDAGRAVTPEDGGGTHA